MHTHRAEVGYTGRDRWIWRPRWFRQPVLVQQIEVQVEVTDNIGYEVDVYRVNEWRDTRVDDIGLWRRF